MQMKHLLVALLVLLALVGTAAAANSLEVRGEVLNYSTDLPATITADEWAGFYYNLDEGISTETIALVDAGSNKVNVTYTTTVAFQNYDYDGWYDVAAPGTNYGYGIIGFFAEPYVALGTKNVHAPTAPPISTPPADVKANKLAKLLIDDDEKYTLKTGANLELGGGYSLIVDQIDVAGNKAYLKLMKDGQEINSSIVNTNETKTLNSSTWILSMTILGEKDMQVMRVHVKDVFQGTESSLVEIDGLWMVDYMNAIEVKSDDKYGKFEADSISSTSLSFFAKEIALNAGDIEIGKGIFFKVQDGFTGAAGNDRFYLYKKYTEPGTYEIRSTVFDYSTAITNMIFNYKNFAAFYYDIDDNLETEKLTILDASATGIINKGNLTYSTTPTLVNYAYDWYDGTTPTPVREQFYIMGLFGEKYVPFNIVQVNGTLATSSPLKADKMAKLVIDDDTKYTLKTGATLELGDGYSIIVDQIDVAGNKAYLKFFYDGQEINSSIVNTNNSSGNWILRTTLLGESNVQTFRVHVKDVFQGTQDSLVEIDGIWLMDYKKATEVKSGDKYGIMECDGFNGTAVNFKSDTNVSLVADMDKQIANNLYLKSADSLTIKKAYFYVNGIIDGEGPEQPPGIEEPPVDPPVTTPPEGNTTPPEGNTTPPVDDKPVEKTFWQKYGLYIIIAIVLIIIIAAAAYYFLVMKKQ